ncbi:Uncharacterised protein [Starkeya nomas]|uniref:Uncharacterized protein n=2 Tax=Xanthobacteraceae TaxID=335928 RepID=A0A5S9NCE9_9HYPH|nr:Uncharacterised protein [Starkeya nomas]
MRNARIEEALSHLEAALADHSRDIAKARGMTLTDEDRRRYVVASRRSWARLETRRRELDEATGGHVPAPAPPPSPSETDELAALHAHLLKAQRDLIRATARAGAMPSDNALRKIADIAAAIGAIETMIENQARG